VALYQLVITRGASSGRAYLIREGENLIGRTDKETNIIPQVDLDEVDSEAKISRRHALIERRGDIVTIRDIGSLNGTFVNRSARLADREVVKLRNGDEVIIGDVFLRFEVMPD